MISRLGQRPSNFKAVKYGNIENAQEQKTYTIDRKEKKVLVGADVVVNWNGDNAATLADQVIKAIEGSEVGLQMISVKGLKMWPESDNLSVMSDEWNLRFMPIAKEKILDHAAIVKLLRNLNNVDLDFVRLNNLYLFDDKLGFSLAQGE